MTARRGGNLHEGERNLAPKPGGSDCLDCNRKNPIGGAVALLSASELVTDVRHLGGDECNLEVMGLVRSSVSQVVGDSSSAAHPAHLAGLRAVALLEIFKGVLAVLAGFALFTLLHKDIGDVAENIIEFLHLNPAHRLVQAFLDAADRVSDKKIVAIACVGFTYALIRFIEAYGLWHARAWAEWFAIISGSAYLPLEIIGIIRHPNALHWAVLLINILVVLYMIYVRWDVLRQGNESITGKKVRADTT